MDALKGCISIMKKKGSKRISEKNKKLMFYGLSAMVLYFILHMIYVFVFVGNAEYEMTDMAYVHFVDVGQGDAIIVEGRDFNVLIDGGEGSSGLIPYIQNLGIKEFDYVVATHPHSDHIGGLPDVVYEYEIRNFLMPDAVHTTKTYEGLLTALSLREVPVSVPKTGDTFGNGEILFTVIAPNSAEYENLNNYSIGLKLQCGDVSYLFAGDAEALSETEMIERGYDLSADVYKVSHHGSNTSSTQAFLEKINPRYAVISLSKDNSYGHPHKEVIERLQNIGAEVIRTDIDGNIVIFTDGKNIEVVKNYGK